MDNTVVQSTTDSVNVCPTSRKKYLIHEFHEQVPGRRNIPVFERCSQTLSRSILALIFPEEWPWQFHPAETIEAEQMKTSDKIIQQWTDGNNVV
jgi:hypothetical protein